jgi:Helix-turn-helix
VVWPSGAELGADTLWLETLSATGHPDSRAFLEWRLRHGLSLSAAAQALGISRRMVAYYSNGERPVPRPILLACKGWEVERAA